jgi:hypothetical protein
MQRPASPPALELTASVLSNLSKKRILPAFISDNASNAKKVRFADAQPSEDDIETDVEQSDDERKIDKIVTKQETVTEELMDKLDDLIERLYRAKYYLEEEISERNLEKRLDGGEVLSDKEVREYGSDSDDCPYEFDLSLSNATFEVDVDDFFKFIWDYVEEKEIHRIVGAKGDTVITREKVEFFLASDPISVFKLLEIALEQASEKLLAMKVALDAKCEKIAKIAKIGKIGKIGVKA